MMVILQKKFHRLHHGGGDVILLGRGVLNFSVCAEPSDAMR